MECQSALYRRHRAQPLSPVVLEQALQRLAAIIATADVVAPTVALRDRAGRLLAAHALRAADALQLAAALEWCDDASRAETIVCLDQRFRAAARREGFAVLPA